MAIKFLKAYDVVGLHCKQKKEQTGQSQAENDFQLLFSDGINAIVAEDEVNASHLLDMLYTAVQNTLTGLHRERPEVLPHFFTGNRQTDREAYYQVSDGRRFFTEYSSPEEDANNHRWYVLDIRSIYLPSASLQPDAAEQREMLRNSSFVKNKDKQLELRLFLDKFAQVIGGQVILEDKFYLVKSDHTRTELAQEQDFICKLGFLWYILKNNMLQKESVLIWDEPEAGLKQGEYSVLIDVLLELERKGIQIFLTARKKAFIRELNAHKRYHTEVQFHHLTCTAAGRLECASAYSLTECGIDKKAAV